MPRRVFLISPASCSGERARILLRDAARFDLALRIRNATGAPLGEVFAFLSGLYFRGKLTYARRFAEQAADSAGTFVITARSGLRPPEEAVRIRDLRRFAEVDIDARDLRFRRPFLRDARALAARLGPDAEVVLLGSIATGKYVDVLLDVFGARLLFPRDFVGRGDMSRGGLLLRHARAGRELDYAPVLGTERHGRRPPRLRRVPRQRAAPPRAAP
ncbi:MAG TPA: hypothetical protein VGH97_05690 [Thermoanaerobaculia bacterium]